MELWWNTWDKTIPIYFSKIKSGVQVLNRTEIGQALFHNSLVDNLNTEQEIDVGILDLVGIDECSLAVAINEIVVLDGEGTADLGQVGLSVPESITILTPTYIRLRYRWYLTSYRSCWFWTPLIAIDPPQKLFSRTWNPIASSRHHQHIPAACMCWSLMLVNFVYLGVAKSKHAYLSQASCHCGKEREEEPWYCNIDWNPRDFAVWNLLPSTQDEGILN